jgi:tetratricopeptide (TPR) repeat protein
MDEQTIVECDKAIHFLNTGRPAEAAQAFTDFLIKYPKVALAWNNRGLALMQLGHPFDAVMNIEKAIALEPAAEYYLNLGAAYVEYEQMETGIEHYRKCIELNPKIAHAYMNIGNALKYQGKLQEALGHYRTCVKIDPTYVDGHLVRAFAELAAGNYKAGWDEFEWRWKSNQLVPRGLPIPEWDGCSLEGKTLLIYGEQGHGDSLQFIRYASMVKEKFGGTVWVEVRQPLVRLIKTVEGIDRVLPYGEDVPVKEIDYMIPVMSLPRIFGTTVDTIPWNGPYFKADPYRAGLWREKLKALPKGMLIGLCWAGLSRPGRPQAESVDRRRSTTLQMFAPLAKIPGISWVSLQKGLPRDQVMTPPTGMTIGDWSEEFDDFYDTAALIENLDLVITVDTAVVHLAAAMGKPTWLLSRWDGCWRWLGSREDSPWYPTLRQFVQPQPHAWEPMVEQVARALREVVGVQNKKAA